MYTVYNLIANAKYASNAYMEFIYAPTVVMTGISIDIPHFILMNDTEIISHHFFPDTIFFFIKICHAL